MDPTTIAVLESLTEAMQQIRDRLTDLEARFTEHSNINFTTYSEFRRLEEATALANRTARNASADVEQLTDLVGTLIDNSKGNSTASEGDS